VSHILLPTSKDQKGTITKPKKYFKGRAPVNKLDLNIILNNGTKNVRDRTGVAGKRGFDESKSGVITTTLHNRGRCKTLRNSRFSRIYSKR
jgi:hypothetical protein